MSYYKYDPCLEESYCIKTKWSSGSWRWLVYLKAERPRNDIGWGRVHYENFNSDPEDADYVWVARGPDSRDSETYEQALAWLRKECIAPRIEMKRLADVIVHAPFPETFEL